MVELKKINPRPFITPYWLSFRAFRESVAVKKLAPRPKRCPDPSRADLLKSSLLKGT